VADRVVFLRPDAQRIARAVRAFENGDRDESPLTFRRPDEPPPKVIRTATFTSAWTVGEIKTVTFKNVTATPNTTRVGNLTFDLFPSGTATSFDCVIGKVTGPSKITAANETVSWVLVSAEDNPIRVAWFTGVWGTHKLKTVTIEDGATPPRTVRAANLTFSLFPFGAATAYQCTIAKLPRPNTAYTAEGTAEWKLVSAEERPVRDGYYTGTWAIGQAKVVQLYQQAQPSTVNVFNLTLNLPAHGTATARDCAVASVGGQWLLVSADVPPPPTFRVCTFPSAAWSKNSNATVTFKNVTTTPNTASAINLFAAISTSASTARSGAVHQEGTAWYLIAAECD
jgi:hypothetical protein